MHVLHCANELFVRVRLSFQKFSQIRRSTCRNNTRKCLGKELWHVLVVVKSTDRDKPHLDLFSATISTSKKMFIIQSARRARPEKGIARHIDAGSVVWLRPSNFWLICSEHAHARYPGLSFRPPGFSLYMGAKKGVFRDWTTHVRISYRFYQFVTIWYTTHSYNSLRRRANARNVSFRISLRWLTYIVNSVDKTKLSNKNINYLASVLT